MITGTSIISFSKRCSIIRVKQFAIASLSLHQLLLFRSAFDFHWRIWIRACNSRDNIQ
ncbi:MAG: hypothetical protein K0S23_2142 [Fluviicola sp.]|jgi:hypothetical protein|nr:hypothetical protein [Fluviicola sp.]